MANTAPLIRVKSGLPDNRVALHERHPDHPVNTEGEHEVFIYGDQEFQAARTAEVGKHLASGELVEVAAEDGETKKTGGKAKADEGAAA